MPTDKEQWDEAAREEIQKLSQNKGAKAAFVYSKKDDAIAVGQTIHAVLAHQLKTQMGCAGFLENRGFYIAIIHWPASPVDAGGSYALPDVERKLKALGFTNVKVERGK